MDAVSPAAAAVPAAAKTPARAAAEEALLDVSR